MNKRIPFWLFLFLVFQMPGLSYSFPGRVSFNGFGTIAVTSSDSETLGFRRNFLTAHPVTKNSPDFRTDSLIGAQANAFINQKLKAHVQFLFRDSEEHDLDDLLHYAYIDFHPFHNLSFRFGRNPLDIFLLSDYRNVGFAYIWVRPVNGMYSTLFADFYEGIQVRYSRPFASGNLSLAGYVGTLDVDLPLSELKRMDFSYEPLMGINAHYEKDFFKLIAGYQRGIIKNLGADVGKMAPALAQIPTDIVPLAPYAASYMNLNDSHCDYISVGFSYDDNSWIIQSEFSKYFFEKALELTYNSAYISIGYRWKNFVPFIAYSKFYNSIKFVNFTWDMEKIFLLSPEMFKAFSDLTALNRDVDAHQDMLSFGIRWNIANNYALKLQWDHNWIKRATTNSVEKGQTLLWATNPAIPLDADQEVNVFSVSFDFFF